MQRFLVITMLGLASVSHAAGECPRAVDTDEHVLESAECLDKAGNTFAAIKMYDLVVAKFPRSKLGPRALHRSAELHALIASYEQAAGRFEQYANRYSGEKDAFYAMITASRYRAAIGDRERWIQDTQFVVRMYGAKKQTEAAQLMFDLTPAFAGDRDATVKHLRSYIMQFGSHGGDDALVVVQVQLGDALRDAACPVATIDGLCARRVAQTKAACESRPQLLGVARRPRVLKEALVTYQAAIATVDRLPGKRTNNPAVLAAYGRAKLALADSDFEALLAQPFPKLSFTTRDASNRSSSRFGKFVDRLMRDAAKVAGSYEAILALREPRAKIAAVARLGQNSQMIAARFLGSPLPHNIRLGEFGAEKAGAYCDAMRRHVEPLDERAKEAFGACMAHANELGVHDEWAVLCMRELTRADPQGFPALSEHVAAPGATDVPLVIAD